MRLVELSPAGWYSRRPNGPQAAVLAP